MVLKFFKDELGNNGSETSPIDSSRDNTEKPFSADYHVQGLRLWGHPEIIWPTFEVYQRDLPRLRDIWPEEEFYLGTPFIRERIQTHADFSDYREAMIRTLVELPCAELVRQIMDMGFYTTYSNAYAAGEKGVYWFQTLDDVIAGRDYYFTDLLTGKTIKRIMNFESEKGMVTQETNYKFNGIGNQDLRAFEKHCADNVVFSHAPAQSPMDAFAAIERISQLRGRWSNNRMQFIPINTLASDEPTRPTDMPQVNSSQDTPRGIK